MLKAAKFGLNETVCTNYFTVVVQLCHSSLVLGGLELGIVGDDGDLLHPVIRNV